jgi:hypothetical protein
MTRKTNWGLVACLAAVLMGASIGCHPASSTGSTPTTPKATKKQSDDKGAPVKPPKPDVG